MPTEDEKPEIKVRARVWITKIDCSGEEPEAIEEICVENGEFVSRTQIGQPAERSV